MKARVSPTAISIRELSERLPCFPNGKETEESEGSREDNNLGAQEPKHDAQTTERAQKSEKLCRAEARVPGTKATGSKYMRALKYIRWAVVGLDLPDKSSAIPNSSFIDENSTSV